MVSESTGNICPTCSIIGALTVCGIREGARVRQMDYKDRTAYVQGGEVRGLHVVPSAGRGAENN